MATAGHLSKLYITTTDVSPTSADLVNKVVSSGLNRNRAELDTNYQGDDLTGFITGKKGYEIPLSLDYDSTNAGQQRIEAAFDSGATIYAHWSVDGTTACKKLPVKVSSFSIESSQDGKVTATPTLKSVGALGSSTAS